MKNLIPVTLMLAIALFFAASITGISLLGVAASLLMLPIVIAIAGAFLWQLVNR